MEELDQLADLHLGFGLQRLALVERQHAGELVSACLDHVRRAVQQRGALEAGAAAPGVEGGVRRRDRAARVLAAPLRHGSQRLSGGRAVGLDSGAAGGVTPLAVDEHPRGHGRAV